MGAVTAEQVRIEHRAYREFSHEFRHDAHLNFVGCFSSAPARATGEPLPCKCGDFIHTAMHPVA